MTPCVSEKYIERLECPECGIEADRSLFPPTPRYHAKGCTASHKPVLVRYYRERLNERPSRGRSGGPV